MTDFKAIGFSAATATVVAAGIVFVSTPVAAAIVQGSVLAIDGNARLRPIEGSPNLWNLHFVNYEGGSNYATVEVGSTHTFASLIGSNVRVQDIQLTKSGNTWTLASAPDPFLQLENGIEYELSTFTLTRLPGPFFNGNFFGSFFDPSDNTSIGGKGLFSSQGQQFLKETGTTFSATITAVPTPALLPGLIAMGVATLRKRRQQEQKAEG
jgi:hypothetical protein